MSAELHGTYDVPLTARLQVFDKYDVLTLLCGLCGASVADAGWLIVVFNEDIRKGMLVRKRGCSRALMEEYPQSVDLPRLLGRLQPRAPRVRR